MSEKILNVVLTHLSPTAVTSMVTYWCEMFPECDLMIAYGGSRADFDQIDFERKVFVDDQRLRTKDHQRECQSYTGVFKAIHKGIQGGEYYHLFFTEFDQIPLVADLHRSLLDRMEAEKADVLLHHLQRVDQSNNAHALFHLSKKTLSSFFTEISCRENVNVMLSALGFGQFWKFEAFRRVAEVDDKVGIYLELWIPSVAHHLGYRVRGMGQQDEFNHFADELSEREVESHQIAGAWCVHPVKNRW